MSAERTEGRLEESDLSTLGAFIARRGDEYDERGRVSDTTVHGQDRGGALVRAHESEREGSHAHESEGERGGQWVVWAVGACLLCVITVLLAEIIVILALAAGPALSLTAEMNGLVRNMNGFLAGSSQAGFATQAAPSANQTSSSPSNATVVGEGAEDALLEWCEGAACLSGQNCTEVLTHLAEGVDPATGAPIIPLPQPFCNSVKVMNENLCFCGDAHADFPEEARVLLDNLGFVSMLCSGFGQENIGQSGRCAAGGGRP